MMTFSDLASVPSHPLVPFTDQLRLAVAAYLARFKGSSREHTESDLRCYLTWCAGRRLDPLAAQRPHLELYIRRMQEKSAGSSPPPCPGGSRLGRVLPHLRPRRHLAALTRRACAPS